MDAKMQLSQLAIEIANDHFQRAESLKPEFQKLQTRLAQIEGQIHAANLCHKRIPNFRPEISGDLQCPRCWVLSETETSLTPVASETEGDLFRCPKCGDPGPD